MDNDIILYEDFNGLEIKVLGSGKVYIRSMVNGKENLEELKMGCFNPKTRKNMVSVDVVNILQEVVSKIAKVMSSLKDDMRTSILKDPRYKIYEALGGGLE